MDYYRRMLWCVFIYASALLRLSAEQKVEGEICTGENKPRFCEEIADCLTAEVNDGGRSPICSFYDELAPLCCRPIFEDVESFYNYSKSWQGENQKGLETVYNHTKSSQGKFSYESVSNISSKKSALYFLAPTERTTVSDKSTSASTQRTTVPTKRTTVPTKRTTVPAQTPTASIQRTTVLTQITIGPTTVPAQTPTVSTQRTTVPTTLPTQTPILSIQRTTVSTQRTTVSTQRTTVPTTVPTQTPTVSIQRTTVSTQRTTLPPQTSPSSVPLTSNKAKQKCEEYGKYVYVQNQYNPLLGDGGNKYVDRCAIYEQSLVLGGENGRPYEFPHMAHIGESVIPGKIKSFWCGGSLISERFVVSVAFCSVYPEKTKNRTVNAVQLGAWKEEFNDDNSIILKIIDRYFHPNFQWPRYYNDIVLFKLERDVKFGFKIRPICLETENYLPKRAVLTGWGKIEYNDGPSGFSEILQKTILSIVNVTKCSKYYADPRLPNCLDENTMICAGDELGSGRDSCSGDQGGPLQYQLKKPYCTYSLIGIYSFGPRGKCNAGIPQVYTRVSYYVPWIESIVWPE